MLEVMLIAGLPLILLGIGYPLCGLVAYPLYRMLGGRKSLLRYMKEL